MELQANGLIAVSAIEYIDIYTWQVPPVESVPPKSDPPTGFELVVPTGLAFTDSSGSNPRAFLAWTENTDYPVDEYRATVLDSGSKPVVNKIVNDNYVYLDLLAVGSYTATVTAINSVGSESNPSSALSFSVAQEPIYTTDVQDAAVSTIKIAVKAVSSFIVATGAKTFWYQDNLSETAIVTSAVFQAPANTDNPFAIIGNTAVVANSGSASDFVRLRLYRRSASTSNGVSSATYINIADYKMFGDSAEAIQTISDSDSYTADYFYQYKMTLQTQGTSTIGGQTRSYGASVLQVFTTYR